MQCGQASQPEFSETATGPLIERPGGDGYELPSAGMLIIAPIASILISNLDIGLLLAIDPESALGRHRIGLWATIPLSIVAAGWTYWFFFRMYRDARRREQAEASLRISLGQQQSAMSALQSSLQREVALRRELDHRVRNNLAGLIGLVGVYEESGRSATELAGAVRGKILALGEVYRLINSTGRELLELRSLMHSVIGDTASAAAKATITLDGPQVTLNSAEASSLAMIVQELLANSEKYGALRPDAGPNAAVHVTWQSRRSELGTELDLQWRESPVDGGRPCRESGSVGLPLIRGFAETDLRGGIEFSKQQDEWCVALRARLKPTPAEQPSTAIACEVCT